GVGRAGVAVVADRRRPARAGPGAARIARRAGVSVVACRAVGARRERAAADRVAGIRGARIPVVADPGAADAVPAAARVILGTEVAVAARTRVVGANAGARRRIAGVRRAGVSVVAVDRLGAAHARGRIAGVLGAGIPVVARSRDAPAHDRPRFRRNAG